MIKQDFASTPIRIRKDPFRDRKIQQEGFLKKTKIAKLAQNLSSYKLCCIKIELDFIFKKEQNQFDKIIKYF